MPGDPLTTRGTGRETIFLLVDEIRRDGLGRRTRTLIDGLARAVDIVLVAQCYLGRWHPARWLRLRHELYRFPPDGFDEAVRAFAARITDRHRPAWVLAYGWENSQLVGALDRLDLPIVAFTDYRSTASHAEDQIHRIFRHASEILFSDETIPRSLPRASRILEARSYRTLSDILPPTPCPSPQGGGEGHDRLGRFAVEDVLVSAGRNAAVARARMTDQQARDTEVIDAAGGVDPDLAIRRGDDPRDATAAYLRASRSVVPRDRIFTGRLLRRPIAGFNPLIYASDNPDFDEASGEDPLAHFIRSGRPAGRWHHDVIRSRPDTPAVDGPTAVHAHLHYPDLLPELLERLALNRSKTDLVITTTSDGRRAEIDNILADAGIHARSILVCENRGRDIWPFIQLLQSGALAAYDVVCHVHGKRSPHYDQGQIWRDFLWTHLIGGGADHMVDAVLDRFTGNAQLGLVFAEEPHLEGWELDLDMASDLAGRIGLALPLPLHFDYPMGTMFWARPAALEPLLRLGLTPDDIPEEPLAIDGTILHALERLIPFLVAAAGFSYATTRVPGSTR